MTDSTLAENVADALRHAIFNGEYLSGERLLELVLTQEMHVSQSTVRDALRILERDGLVVKRPRLGVYVRAHTPEDVDEVYRLWAALEGIALERAAVEHDLLPDLRAVIEEARRYIPAGPARGFIDAVFAFHRGVSHAASGPLTIALLDSIHNQGRLLEIVRQMRAPRTFRQQAERLEACARMLDAVEAGDVAQARQALETALETDRQALRRLLESV